VASACRLLAGHLSSSERDCGLREQAASVEWRGVGLELGAGRLGAWGVARSSDLVPAASGKRTVEARTGRREQRTGGAG